MQVDSREQIFYSLVYRSNGALVLELQPAVDSEAVNFSGMYHLIESLGADFQSATDLKKLCQLAAVEIRRLTSFDRVMIY